MSSDFSRMRAANYQMQGSAYDRSLVPWDMDMVKDYAKRYGQHCDIPHR